MSIWIRWTPKQERMWADWLAARPPVIQEMVTRYNFRPDRLYVLKTTGQKVTLDSLSENTTVTVNVLSRFNSGGIHNILGRLAERTVFNINPADLEECEWVGEIEDGALCEDLEG